MCCSNIGIGIGDRNIIWFCNYNCNHGRVAGVLGYGLVPGKLYVFGIVTGILNSFRNDNGKRRMSCICIGMGLVTYYMGLVMILEGIGNGNVIWF